MADTLNRSQQNRWVHLPRSRSVVATPVLLTIALAYPALGETKATHAPAVAMELIDKYCGACHGQDMQKGDLDLLRMLQDEVTLHADDWERVVRKLRARQMPPVGRKRPSEKTLKKVIASLSSSLDSAAANAPNPGRSDTFRRLNRTEYGNAIRDLLALQIDPGALLPKDDASHGFDNVTVSDLSPTLLNRYVGAAEKVSRLAVGRPLRSPGGDTFRLAPDLTQEHQVEGLPPGTRGGALIDYNFPRIGTYEVQVRLTRDRNEVVEGLAEAHELQVLLDKAPVQRFTVAPPVDQNFEQVDAHLKARIAVAAGPHKLGITFLKTSSSVIETRRQPYLARYNMHRHPRLGPAVYQISINGPYDDGGSGDTPSRRRIFGGPAPIAIQSDVHAEQIIVNVLRRAYRRPVTAADVRRPMEHYKKAAASEGFEAGVEAALAVALSSPAFLFRVERDPPNVRPGAAYQISDLELASRVSFFLWSSIPDDELLGYAERGELSQPQVLENQVLRMLADPRALNLTSNFAAQWLYLRNLDAFTPDLRLFPDFDDNLRQAFRRETELHFETMQRENRSVLNLLTANFTFLNERLAKHYGIPNVYGNRFRRVALGTNSARGGLLRQGSLLTVTSYATRTSPVIRGHFVLGNLLGTPPPPPPPDVPVLKENTVSATLPMRQRLSEHRANAACAGCHNLMDPVGFSLENFDAIGRWRVVEDGIPVDAAGSLPNGRSFSGVRGLEQSLRDNPDLFVGTLAEKLMTFALGRGVQPSDAPAIRQIVTNAKANDNRFSSLVLAIVRSQPFLMRRAQ